MRDETTGPALWAESLTTYAFGPRDRTALAAWAAEMGLTVEEDSETRGRLVPAGRPPPQRVMPDWSRPGSPGPAIPARCSECKTPIRSQVCPAASRVEAASSEPGRFTGQVRLAGAY
jgi:hypothetical protein